MVVHGFLWVWAQPGLQSVVQDSQACLKKNQTKQKPQEPPQNKQQQNQG